MIVRRFARIARAYHDIGCPATIAWEDCTEVLCRDARGLLDVSARGDGTYRQLAAAVLVAHQRRADSNCLCGGLTLGESWADHVAGVLDAAGALRDGPARVPAEDACEDGGE